MPPPPPPPAADLLRARTRSVMARFDPTGVRPTMLVAGVIVALFFGAQLVNAVLPAPGAGPGPQPQPGGAVDIGPLRVSLAPGWQAVDGPLGPRLARGSVAIDFQVDAFDGDAASLYRVFVEQALAPHATGFSATDPSLVQVGSGIAGARGAYAGVFGTGASDGQVEGQLTVFVVDGTGVVIDAWGPMGTLRPLLSDVELMISTIEVR
jgi:hypothetical protein